MFHESIKRVPLKGGGLSPSPGQMVQSSPPPLPLLLLSWMNEREREWGIKRGWVTVAFQQRLCSNTFLWSRFILPLRTGAESQSLRPESLKIESEAPVKVCRDEVTGLVAADGTNCSSAKRWETSYSILVKAAFFCHRETSSRCQRKCKK